MERLDYHLSLERVEPHGNANCFHAIAWNGNSIPSGIKQTGSIVTSYRKGHGSYGSCSADGTQTQTEGRARPKLAHRSLYDLSIIQMRPYGIDPHHTDENAKRERSYRQLGGKDERPVPLVKLDQKT